MNTNESQSTPDASQEAPRPKFARRPASFARSPLPVPVDTGEMAAERPQAKPAAAHGTPWQEDARFGIAMLVLIVLVNGALVYGLPLLADTRTHQPVQVQAKAPTMPSATGNRNDENVTMYSQPEAERRTIYLLDLRNTASEQNTLSVSPHDYPAPTARALDPAEQ